MLSFKRTVDFVNKYQVVLIIIMLILGLVLPRYFQPLHPFNSFFLQVIMFSTGLHLDFKEFFREIKDWKTLLLGTFMMLVGIPILISIPLYIFAPDWSLPFIIAAAMPTGLTAPALISVVGGRTSLALLLAIATSALAPFTIPLVLYFLAGQSVHVSILDMMWQIGSVLILPLVLAGVIQYRIKKSFLKKTETAMTALSLISFALVVASIASSSFSGSSNHMIEAIGYDGLLIATLMMIFWLGIAWLATSTLTWRTENDKITISFCLIYMSYTLGLWVADTFFHEMQIAPKLIAIVILVIALVPVFKLFFFLTENEFPKPKK